MGIRDDDGLTTGSASATGIEPYATLNRRSRGVRMTYIAAVAVGLAIGGGAIAGAATGSAPSTTQPTDHAEGPGEHADLGGSPPAAFGTVASVGSNSFTLTSHDGTTVTVDVSSTTTYLDPALTTPSFSDVKVGDRVAVFGTDTTNTVVATKVAVGGVGGHGDGPGGMGGLGGPPPAAEGAVASVSTNAFTLTTHDGTKVTVAVGTGTTYNEFGKTSASINDVAVGVHVAVFGTDVNNSVTATHVGIARSGGLGGLGDMAGDDDTGVSAPYSSSATAPSGVRLHPPGRRLGTPWPELVPL